MLLMIAVIFGSEESAESSRCDSDKEHDTGEVPAVENNRENIRKMMKLVFSVDVFVFVNVMFCSLHSIIEM